MKEKHGFDMLENAGDMNVERIAEHTELTDNEKKRILEKSIKKLGRKGGDMPEGEQVSGVEQYKRPRWYSFAATAACFVLVAGVVGGAMYFGGRGSHEIDPLATTVPETTASAEATAPAETTAAAEEDLEQVADDMLEELIQFRNITRGYMVRTDVNMTKTVETDEGTVVYERVLGADTIEDVKEIFKEHLTEGFIDSFSYLWDENASAPMFKVFDGKLYHLNCRDEKGAALYSFTVNDKIEITAQDENSFSFNRSGLDMNDERQSFSVSCIKEDGKWKINSYSCSDDDSEAETTEPTTVPEGIDLTAFHTDEYGAVVFDKPVEKQSEATLKAAAKTLWANAARIAWACKLYETTLDDGCTLPDDVDGERFIEANDLIYALVKDENVKSIDDVIAGYHRLFSDKYPYDSRLDDEFYYTEYNGRMYFSVYAGQRGSNIDYDDSEIASYDGRDGNEMHFTVHDNYDATQFGGEAYTKNNEFTMVLGDDGVWRVGKYTLPY